MGILWALALPHFDSPKPKLNFKNWIDEFKFDPEDYDYDLWNKGLLWTYIFFNKTGQIASELIGKIILVSWVELQELQKFGIPRMELTL